MCITSHLRQDWGNPHEKKDRPDTAEGDGVTQQPIPKVKAKAKARPTPLLLERKVGEQKIASPKDALSRKLLIPLYLTTISH